MVFDKKELVKGTYDFGLTINETYLIDMDFDEAWDIADCADLTKGDEIIIPQDA